MAKSILIVEDDAAIRESLAELLELEGYRLLLAQNGREALDMLQAAGAVDLILLDLTMPEMDGHELIQRLDQLPDRGAIPVVVVSAASPRNPEPDRIRYYLSKPILIEHLLELIEKLT